MNQIEISHKWKKHKGPQMGYKVVYESWLTKFELLQVIQAIRLLETTWKQARNETFKVHEMKQLY